MTGLIAHRGDKLLGRRDLLALTAPEPTAHIPLGEFPGGLA